MKKSIIFSIVLLAFICSDCTNVAMTGRSQLNLIPNSEIIPMSFDQYKQVISESKLSQDQEKTNMVKTVGQNIKGAVEKYMKDNGLSSQLNGFKWEFNLIEDKTVNAWCMPGGKVAFYTGIMPICKDEAGIAVVMGHEVAHAIANHGRERMSQNMVAQIGLTSLSAAMGANPTLTKSLFMQSVGIGTQVGMLKFSRTHESEADKMGLIFMAMAGYNPEVAPKFWERMSSMSGGQAPPEWLSTHPSHDTRISDLNAQMPEAKKYYQASKKK